VALARQGAGRAMIRLGDTTEGVALLDEVMVGVVSDEISPVAAGVVYCSVIDACVEIFDVRRAQEWTDALAGWCASQPDLVAYRGECLVRRAEIMHLHGQWPDAAADAEQAARRLAPPPVGAAFYQLGEIRRLRGDLDAAEQAYRQAGEAGKPPHPGLALLWLARGEVDAAQAAIRRVLDEARERRVRSRVLPAFIDIQLEAGDVAAARQGADELAAMAADVGTPFLRAVAAQALGAVLVAEREPRAALGPLRDAEALWRDLQVPYERARVGVLIARACRDLDDAGSARLELDAALAILRALDARHEIARAECALDAAPAAPAGGLTTREAQVLRLVATGRTNRAISRELAISEKTVARHISNIFTKLDLSSRAAATAYAFRHKLV
jgi:DNA-binding CsgD family transcriptional regulator